MATYKGKRTLGAALETDSFWGPNVVVGPHNRHNPRDLGHEIDTNLFKKVFGFLPPEDEVVTFRLTATTTKSYNKKVRAKRAKARRRARREQHNN